MATELLSAFDASNPAKVLLVEGTHGAILQSFASCFALLPRDRRYLFITDQQESRKEIRTTLYMLTNLGFMSYSDLSINNGKSVRGWTVVFCALDVVFKEGAMKGMIDGGIHRVIASQLWKNLVITRETDGQQPTVHQFGDFDQAMHYLLQNSSPEGKSTPWLDELLLTLLYRRHLTRPTLLKDVKASIWWHLFQGQDEQIWEALSNLKKSRLIQKKTAHYTCTEYGIVLIDRDIPLEGFDLEQAAKTLETEKKFQPKQPPPVVPDKQLTDLIVRLVDEQGWTFTGDVVSAARHLYPDFHISRSAIRRLLVSLTAENVLATTVYNRGVGRPLDVYHKYNDDDGLSWMEDRCGECAFYVNNLRRCRLWWALNRYAGNIVHGKWDQLSKMSREKLRYGITGMGPKATACEQFLPRKRDYPIRQANQECLGCGSSIDSPLTKSVRCGLCGTEYRPLADRILVLYNYNHVLKEKYLGIAGVPPPGEALNIEERAQGRSKNLIVLYPDEQVKLNDKGIRIRKEKAEAFESYDRIYHIVDYGALSERRVKLLEERGVSVSRRPLPVSHAIVQQSDLVQSMRAIRTEGRLTRILADSLISSVIIATKRMVESATPDARSRLLEPQLIEYRRMEATQILTLDKLLGFEARVNLHYWQAYKDKLKLAGLGFKSRVRERFVRELIRISRARARGYSPVNAAINYLHQRRLMRCGAVNVEIGLPQTEGILHVAKRKSGLGLLLDLSESFKLADREKLIEASLHSEITIDDFASQRGQQGVRFYYPKIEAISKLERIGQRADELRCHYQGRECSSMEAYGEYAKSFKLMLDSLAVDSVIPFIYGSKVDQEWFAKTKSEIASL